MSKCQVERARQLARDYLLPVRCLDRIDYIAERNKEQIRKFELSSIRQDFTEHMVRDLDGDVYDAIVTAIEFLYLTGKIDVPTHLSVRDNQLLTKDKNIFKVSRLLAGIDDESFHKIFTHSITANYLSLNTNSATHDKNTFLSRYFDTIKGGRTISLTTDWVDMMFVNHNASYTSCFSPQGQYFNAVTVYATDSITAVCLVKNAEGRTIGRSWIYFPDDETILFGRAYGCIDQHIRNIIKQSLGHTEFLYNYPTGRARSVTVPRDGTPLYWDGILDWSTTNSQIIDKLLKEGYYDDITLHFPPGICLNCGEAIFKDKEYGLCGKCAGNCARCVSCGRLLAIPTRSSSEGTKRIDIGNAFCSNCLCEYDNENEKIKAIYEANYENLYPPPDNPTNDLPAIGDDDDLYRP